MPFKAKNNREAVVVCAIHVVKRPSKRSVLVIIIIVVVVVVVVIIVVVLFVRDRYLLRSVPVTPPVIGECPCTMDNARCNTPPYGHLNS